MGKATKRGAQSKPKHHRFKKLLKLAAFAGAVYGTKKLWDQQRGRKTSPK